MKKLLHQLRLKLAVFLHNKSYSWISASAAFINNGIHPKHRLMKYHDFFVSNITVRERVLDIGCGNGLLAYDLSQKARSVTGIDLVQSNIDKANRNFQRKNLEFICGDITKINIGKYDVVVLSNVLEHIRDRKKLLQKIRKLSPKLLIRVPLITRSWLPLYLKEQGFDYRLDTTHEIEYTEQEILGELDSTGFTVLRSLIAFGEYYAVCK